MITWRDLFNFDGAEAATKKAVAQINQLDQAYDNWVKGMKTNKNVLDKSVKELVASMGQLKKGLEQVNPATKENQQAISAASKQVEVSATQYKKLTAALDQTQKELKQLQAEHKKVIEGRKKANAGLSEAEKLRRRLTRAQSEGGKELVKLRTQIAAVNAETRKQVKETMAQSNAYEKLKNNVNKAQLNFKNMAAQFGVNSAQAKRAQKEFDKVDKELRQINNAARDGRRDVGRYGLALGKAGGMATKLAGALGFAGLLYGLVSAFKAAGKTVMEFEKANAELEGVLLGTAEEMKELQDSALELGATTAKTATEVVALQTAYARLGFTQQEILDLTKDTINGSIAMNASLEDTANLTGAVINTFADLSTTDADRVLDSMTRATQLSALNFEKLSTAIPIVSGAASAAGVEFEEMTALLGKLADSGIDASTSATALRNIFIKSAAQGKSYKETLNEVSQSSDRLTAANELFGVRGAVAATILSELGEEAKVLEGELRNAGGTAESVADIQLDTLSGAVTLLGSAWDGFILGIEEGDGAISRLVRGSLESLTTLLNNLTVAVNGIDEAAIKQQAIQEGLRRQAELDKEEFKGYIERMKQRGIAIEELDKAAEEYLQNDLARLNKLQTSGSWDEATAERERSEIEILKTRIAAIREGAQEELNVEQERKDQLAKILKEEADERQKQQAAINAKRAEQQAKDDAALRKQIEKNEAEANSFGTTADAHKEYVDRLIADQERLSALEEQALADAEMGFEDEEYWEKLDALKEGTKQTAAELAAEQQAIIDKAREGFVQTMDAAFVAVNDYGGRVLDIFAGLTDRALMKDEQRIEELEERRNLELEQAGQNADQRAAIEKRFQDEKNKIQEEQNKKNRRLAIAQKAFDIIRIGIDTARAATAALVPPPIGAGPLAGIPLAAGIVAKGALSAAAVAAQPIPQFKDGTEFHQGGLAIVGDGGKHEVISGGGKNVLTPDKPTLVDMPRGYKVFDSIATAEKRLGNMEVDRLGELQVRRGNEAEKQRSFERALAAQAKVQHEAIAVGIKEGMEEMEVHQTFINDGEITHHVRKGNTRYNKWTKKFR
jgi:hypothetical protein